MTKENKKKTLPKFKSLSEMNHYIITKQFGREFADSVREKSEKFHKMRLESPSKYIN